MADQSRTTGTSESALRERTAEDLREEAKEAGVSGTSGMRKDDLVDAVAEARDESSDGDDAAHGPGPDGGGVREGSQSSDSLKYSQEISSPDEDPERPGRSLVTTHHDVIREWAESRGGTPADVEGTGDKGAGVLRIEFRDEGDRLEDVGWDAFFATFDDSDVDFLYQERTSDGSVSRFHKFVRAGD